MISLIGLLSMITGILLMGLGLRIGKSGMNRDDPEWRAGADKIYKLLGRGGAILGGLGFLLLMLRFLLGNLGVSLE